MLTLVVATAAIGVTGAAVDDVADELERDTQAFEEYCTERFGAGAEVYNSQSLGPHGGLHCADTDTDAVVHYSAIPGPMLEAYARGDVSATAVTQSVTPPATFVEWVGPPGAMLLIGIAITILTMKYGPRR